jgi:hypothetical protein
VPNPRTGTVMPFRLMYFMLPILRVFAVPVIDFMLSV